MIKSWRHINDPVRIKGLNGAQLGLGVLIPLSLFGFSIVLTFVSMIVLLFLWKWYYGLQKEGDVEPLKTIRIEKASPRLIQDNYDFYSELRNTQND